MPTYQRTIILSALLPFFGFSGSLPCAGQEPPAKATAFHPYGPGACWDARFMNEEWNGETKYFAFLLHGLDGEAAGISFAIRDATSFFASDAQAGPAGPWPFVFLGAGWTLRDNLGYAARLVLGPDRGVVGISFRVWNNSATAPLILRRFPAEPLCTIEIRCIDGEQVQRKPKEDPGRWDEKKIVEWVLAPRAKEEIFLPMRDLVREDFDPKSGKFCQLFIRLSAFPKDTPVGAEGFYPDYQFVPVMVTRTSLAVDPQEALKEASHTPLTPRRSSPF